MSNLSHLGYNETVLEHDAGNDWFGVSTGETKWRNRLAKLAEQYPDEVKCIVKNDDGSVYYHVPESFVTVRKPKQMNLTEEEKAIRAERLRAGRKT